MFLPYFPHRMSLALPKGVSSDGKICNLRMYFCGGDGPGAGLWKFIFINLMKPIRKHPSRVCEVCGKEYQRRRYANGKMEQSRFYLIRKSCSKECAWVLFKLNGTRFKTGRIVSEDERNRSAKSRTGLRHSDETKKKLSVLATGRRHTEETKRKIGKLNLGKSIPMEQRERESRTHKIRCGSDPDKPSRRSVYQKMRSSSGYYRWRINTIDRGFNVCSICGSMENVQAHHRESLRTSPDKIIDPENGMAVCKKCHYWLYHPNIWEPIAKKNVCISESI
jgi:hypothetical protein